MAETNRNPLVHEGAPLLTIENVEAILSLLDALPMKSVDGFDLDGQGVMGLGLIYHGMSMALNHASDEIAEGRKS